MKHYLNLLLFILLTFNRTIAQGEAAIPFLYLSPSPQSNGLGWTGVSIPNNDAFGFYYNPAMIGYFGQSNNLSVQMYPANVDWVFDFITVNSYGLSFGYNFKNELNGLNLSAGAGFIKNRINFGSFTSPSGSFESYDTYNAYAFGAAINYYVTFSTGITFKNIYSKMGISPEGQEVSIDPNAIDYGFLLILPVTDLFDNSIKLSNYSNLIPEFNYSLGYSRLNIGDEVFYIDPAQADPLPRTVRIGHTINLGMEYQSDDIAIDLIDYNLILEADDILITRNKNNNISYGSMFGGISLGKHLIQLKGNENVVVHKGHAINLLETVTILKGSFAGRGYSRGVKTDGLIISSSGLFKWLSSMTENSALQFIANHIELKYINSTIFDGEPIETDFSGLSVSFFNYSFN